MKVWILALLGTALARRSFYECPEMQTITPKHPINTSAIYTFPKRAFTQFPANSACSWIIKIPMDYTVIVQLKATIPEGGHVTITQTPHLNQTEKFVDSIEIMRFFHPPSFDIFWYPGAVEGNLKFSLQFQSDEELDGIDV